MRLLLYGTVWYFKVTETVLVRASFPWEHTHNQMSISFAGQLTQSD